MRINIDDFICLLREMVKCSPCEWNETGRRFDAFVFLDNGVGQLGEMRLGTNTHSLSEYDFLRNNNDFPETVFALERRLVGDQLYRVTVYGLSIYKPDAEHKYLGTEKKRRRSRSNIVDNMNIALKNILDKAHEVCVSKSGCDVQFFFSNNIPDDLKCCSDMVKLKYTITEETPTSVHNYIGSKALFEYQSDIVCDEFYFDCK